MSKTINEILDDYRNTCRIVNQRVFEGDEQQKAIELMAVTNITTKQQLKDLMLEIIGEDEEPLKGNDTNTKLFNMPTVGRNNLRKELRQKVEEL